MRIPGRIAAILFALIFPYGAMGQEFRSTGTLQGNSSVFSVDLSSVARADGASIKIKNNSGTSVAEPMLTAPGAVPLLNVQSIIQAIRAGGPLTDQQFAIATWQFMLGHTQSFCSAGSVFDFDPGSDPIRLLHGYGFACCDQLAAVLAYIWGSAGYQTRVAYFNFHTVPEIYYGGSWHMLDPDHRVYYLSDDNVTIASVQTILAETSLIQRAEDSNGDDPVGSPAATMAALYQENASTLSYGSQPYDTLNSEFSLRPGESFTIHSENQQADIIYQYIGGSSIGQAPAAVTSGEFQWDFDFGSSMWSNYVSSQAGIYVTAGLNGLPVLADNSSTDGYLVFPQSSPYPVFSLLVSAQAGISASNGSALAYLSLDGVSWSSAVPLSANSPGSAYDLAADLSSLARGANSYYIKLELAGGIEISNLQIRSIVQVAKSVFPALTAGAVNNLNYADLSPQGQGRSVEITVAVPQGSLPLHGLSAASQVTEDAFYSIAEGYQAAHLVDGDSDTLAYPGSTQLDYVVHLNGISHVSAASIEWGYFGTDPGYVQSWNLYGRNGTQAWQLLSSGGFPNASTTNLALDAYATDLRITAASNNWIGIYEFRAYGGGAPSSLAGLNALTASSQVAEDPIYSLGEGYGAANLVDGSPNTLAYPGASHIDYVINMGGAVAHVSDVKVTWGAFGSDPNYIQSWTLYGRNGNQAWQTITSGGFPNATVTDIPASSDVTDLRITADGANWLGVYEVNVSGNVVSTQAPSVGGLSVLSNVPEDPYYSIAQGYGAAHLMDGNANTLAYPASSNIDYVINLPGPTHLSSALITWGGFGTNPIYVSNWALMAASADGSWQTVAQGGFPNSPTTSIPLNIVTTQLRLTASSSNWIGVYEVTLQGGVALSNLSASSNVLELPGVSGYGPAASISDGGSASFAYPGNVNNDYTLDLQGPKYVDAVNLVWGAFGSSTAYIRNWLLYGLPDGSESWEVVARGGFPNADQTLVPVQNRYRKLRIAANGSNWIGIYEMQVFGGN